jgi:hypothetical protein
MMQLIKSVTRDIINQRRNTMAKKQVTPMKMVPKSGTTKKVIATNEKLEVLSGKLKGKK